jgi:hypothetical protein
MILAITPNIVFMILLLALLTATMRMPFVLLERRRSR